MTASRFDEDYRLIAELVSDFIFFVNYFPDGHYELVFCGDRFFELSGYDREKLKDDASWRSIMYPADHERLITMFSGAVASGKPGTGVFDYRAGDGVVRTVRLHCRPGESRADNGCVSLIGAAQDITDNRGREESLEKRLNETAIILDNLDVMIALVRNSRIVWINQGGLRLLGCKESDLPRISTDDFIPGYLSGPDFIRDLSEILSRGESVRSEILFTKPSDGRKIWCMLTGKALNPFDLDSGTIWLIEDIDQKRRLEERLSESETRFRLVFENARNAIVWLDMESGDIIKCNRAACEFFELPETRILGRKISELVSLDLDYLKEQQSDSFPQNEIETSIRLPGGTSKWLFISYSLVDLPEKKISQLVFIDTTARKLAEDALRESNRRYGAIFEDSPIAIWELDFSAVHRRFEILRKRGVTDLVSLLETDRNELNMLASSIRSLDMNRETLNLFGVMSREEIKDDYPRYFMPGATQGFVGQLASLYDNVKGYQSEVEIRRKNGEVRLVYIKLSFAGEINSDFSRVLMSLVDITERRQAEQAMLDINRNLERLIREETAKNIEKDRMLVLQSRMAVMGEMVSSIAHQWKQPLHALSLTVQNLLGAWKTGNFTEEYLLNAVDKSKKMIMHLASTIDDFRDFYRQHPEPSAFDLTDSLKLTLTLTEPLFKECRIHLDYQPERGIRARGYPNEFAQAVMNVLTNAAEVIRERKPVGRNITIKVGRAGESVFLSVSDSAGGMAPEVLPRVFDPYFTTRANGTGLGLYLTKMIIEKNMGGRISASNAKDGAEFRIELPAG